MSEYQYYEFLAVDRPLTDLEQAEIRALSTRAQVTATRFTNEYEWGDFKGDPATLMERYYDAHLYYANWGTHRVMLRLPQSLLDPDVVAQYCVGDQVIAWVSGEQVIVDLTSEEDDENWEEEDLDSPLSAIVGVRAELAAGDLRPLYLAWLAAYGSWERDEDAFDYADEDELEPPVPPGLDALSSSQRALARFLRLDDNLLAVAAQASARVLAVFDDQAELGAWLAGLEPARKDALLVRVAEGYGGQVRLELLREFRGLADAPAQPGRSVAELLDAAAARRRAHAPGS